MALQSAYGMTKLRPNCIELAFVANQGAKNKTRHIVEWRLLCLPGMPMALYLSSGLGARDLQPRE